MRIKIALLVVALSLFNLCTGMDNSVEELGDLNTVSIVACEQDEGVVRDKDVLITIEGDKAPAGFLKLKNGKIVAKTRFEEIPTDVFKYKIFPDLDVKGLQGVHQASTLLREDVEKFIFREDLSELKAKFLDEIYNFDHEKILKKEVKRGLTEHFVNIYVEKLKQERDKCKFDKGSYKMPLLFVKDGREILAFLNKDNFEEFLEKRDFRQELKSLFKKELGSNGFGCRCKISWHDPLVTVPGIVCLAICAAGVMVGGGFFIGYILS